MGLIEIRGAVVAANIVRVLNLVASAATIRKCSDFRIYV